MTKLFVGPVELSENPNHRKDTNENEIKWVGTTLRFLFQVKECHAVHQVYKGNPCRDEYIYPQVIIKTRYVKTWEDWQQHEVRLNGCLIGTISNHSSTQNHPLHPTQPEDPENRTFIFKVQPKIIKVSGAIETHLVPQDKVNVLSIEMGTGGFGLNDSFVLDSIELENILTNLDN